MQPVRRPGSQRAVRLALDARIDAGEPASHLADVAHRHELDAVGDLNDLESLAGHEAERFPHCLGNDHLELRGDLHLVHDVLRAGCRPQGRKHETTTPRRLVLAVGVRTM